MTCVVDLGALLLSDDQSAEYLWLGLNILSLSSLAIFEKSTDPNDLSQFQCLRRGLGLFNDDMHTFKTTLTMPPLALFSRDGHLSNKDAKKMLEAHFNPESGFSEEIGNRNLLKNIISSVFESRELLSASAKNSSLKEILRTEAVHTRCASAGLHQLFVVRPIPSFVSRWLSAG